MQAYLRTLGASELHIQDEVIQLSVREAALLAFAARKPHGKATRAELVTLFWPQVEPKNARHSLSQLIYALRQRIPTHLVQVSTDHLTARGIELDLAALSRDIATGHRHEALARYNGPFLASDESISEELKDWRDEVDDEVALTVSDILQEHSQSCATNELEEIIRLCEQVLSAHPHLIGAQVALIQATMRMGLVAKAERIYASLAASDSEAAAALPPIDSFRLRRAAPRDAYSVPFVGRDEELAVLLEAWDRTLASDGQVVVVLGEPGIGKTRLADQFLRRVAIRGGGVWIANCCAATQRLPYSVVNDLIRENLDSTLGPWGFGLAKVDTSVSKGVGFAPDEYRHRLTEDITDCVIQQSATRPLAILVDDAQWADEYTALLIAYWAYRLRREKVMLVLTVRTHEAELPPDWITSDLGRPVSLTLGRISVAAAEHIVAAFERGQRVELERRVRDAVLWQSGGRPFLLIEALSSVLTEQGVSELALSEHAESLLLRRFKGLHDDIIAVAGLLAVWGRPIPEATLRRLSGLADDGFATALNGLHTRGIAYLHDLTVEFAHDLMRVTAYRMLLPATRALYHRKTATELSSTGAPDGLIAQHYAQSGDQEAAGLHSIRAAEQSLSAHAYSDFEFYCKLCMRSGAPTDQHTAAARLARYLLQVGRGSEVDEVLTHLNDEVEESKVLRSISALERDLTRGDRSASDLLQFARRIASTTASVVDDTTRASFAATLFSIAFDASDSELDHAALTAAFRDSSASQHESQLQMESVVSVWHGVTTDVLGGLAMAESTLVRLTSGVSPTTRAACQYAHGTLLLLAGRVREALPQFESALEIAVDSGDVRRQLSVHINRGTALIEAGQLEAARQSLGKAVTAGSIHFRIRCYANLAILHYEEGDMALAVQAAESVLSMNTSYRSLNVGSVSCAILGLVALRNRNYEAARQYAGQISQSPWQSIDDSSYTAMFLSRTLGLAGKHTEALLLLTSTIASTRGRNVLCTMRLECAKATLLMTAQPDAAYRLARDVGTRAKLLGAVHVQRHAQEIVNQINTLPRS